MDGLKRVMVGRDGHSFVTSYYSRYGGERSFVTSIGFSEKRDYEIAFKNIALNLRSEWFDELLIIDDPELKRLSRAEKERILKYIKSPSILF